MIENQWSNYLSVIIAVYFIGVGLFFLRFLRNLISIVNRIINNPRTWKNNAHIVLLKEKIIPHTFLNYIFVNQEYYDSKRIDNELLTHEYSHVNDKHSIDVLLIEIFHIVFWFNPMMIYIKKSIRLNHEFIADDEVVKSHQNVISYQQMLLSLAMWKNDNILTSNLNFMVAKKRFEMMITKSAKKTLLISKALIIPLLIGIVFLFADTVDGKESEKGEHNFERTESNDKEGHGENNYNSSISRESLEHQDKRKESHN